ncbi:hypothetical protein lerEdw1_005007 [Lerista edwardsae]|nr:hypothetical protein lerEdw1_005007 [Lerista edwardsae]
MKPETLWLLAGLLLCGKRQAADCREERKGKDGYCVASPNGLYELPCSVACEADSECERDEKCWKRGKCPRKQRQRKAESCEDTCSHDAECQGPEKCCFTGCSMNCIHVQ